MYALMLEYIDEAPAGNDEGSVSEISEVVWQENGDYVVPWAQAEDLEDSTSRFEQSYPSNCGYYSEK
jgi:hypothetical protein